MKFKGEKRERERKRGGRKKKKKTEKKGSHDKQGRICKSSQNWYKATEYADAILTGQIPSRKNVCRGGRYRNEYIRTKFKSDPLEGNKMGINEVGATG